MNKFKPRNKICFQNKEAISGNAKLSKLQRKKWNVLKKKVKNILRNKKKIQLKPEKRKNFFQKRLFEIQKLRNFYGCIPKYQLKNLFRKLKKKKNQINMFKKFIILLESRLDIIIVRLKLAKTIFQSQQLINHNKIKVNNQIINKPNYLLRKGDIINVIK